MTWNVKEDFCGDGTSCSSLLGTSYQFYPKLRIDTDRPMTEDEKRCVIDALVKAASVEVSKFKEENNNGKEQ